MENSGHNSNSTSVQVNLPLFTESDYRPVQDRIAPALTDSERAESRKQLAKLHPGNRFRLMFGLPLWSEQQGNGKSR